MSNLTKDQLKTQLVSYGVKLPSPSAKKEEYVRLYHKYVAPISRSKGDFSSDDEDFVHNDVKYKSETMATLIINGLNITQLDDDELFARLKNLGATVGPIVGTTRKVYERKLFVLMGGELPDTPAFNGDVDEEEYSDNEDEIVEEPVNPRRSTRVETTRTTYSTTAASTSSPHYLTDIRKRVLISPGEREADTVVFDPDRHTPSPRRSLRTVTSTSTSSESTTYRKFVNNGSSGVVRDSVDETDAALGKPSKMGVCVRMSVKLLFLALIMALALYFYQTTSSENPIKMVEQLARQALEAAAGEQAAEAAVKEGDPLPPPPPPSAQEQKVFPQN